MSHAIGWGWTSTVAAALMVSHIRERSNIQWISFGILLLTIRYGHHWREKANKRYGYDTISEDEKHPPSIRGTETDGDIVKAEEEAGERVVVDEDDAHTELPKRPLASTLRGGKGLERVASGTKLARQRSQGSLPDPRDMLHRTTSTTASVHGGG